MPQDFDWNLLAALDVLLAEGSVTAAADRLNLSVPATSRTLGRIRKTFDDPILVKAGRGLVPTPRALAVQTRLHQLVEEAQALVAVGSQVDLTSLERVFTVRSNESTMATITSILISRLMDEAPGVSLRFVPEGEEDLAPLRDGLIDLDIGVIEDFGPEVRTELICQEHLVGLVRAGHRLAGGRMTLRRIAAELHVGVSRRGRARGQLDLVLENNGLSRRVVAVVPSFPAAAQIILGSDLTGLLPAGYARAVASVSGARVYEIPGGLGPLPLSQAWHVRHDLDPAHVWFRGVMAAAIRDSVSPQ